MQNHRALKTYALISMAIFPLLFSGYSHAQSDEPTVYQVELIVFKRLRYGHEPEPEVWPRNIHLAYPQDAIELIDPKQAPEPVDEDNGLNGNNGNFSNIDEANEQEYFRFLDNTQRSLNRHKAALARNPDLHVLFHETWLQPLVNPDEAPALILHGGGRFGDHYELEGSVTIGVARYLHIHTDLWLSQFVPNIGQPTEHWPQLPLSPSRAHAYFQRLLNASYRPTLEEDASASPYRSTELFGTGSLNLSGTEGNNQAEAAPYNPLEATLYRPNEIVTLRQRRRMRSNELHYLDHPRLGVIVKITRPES